MGNYDDGPESSTRCVEVALARFGEGFNCSQAVLSAFAESFGLDNETALRLAAGFGGGMRMGDTCGTVTGAFMVLGLMHRAASADSELKEKVYGQVREFAQRFRARNGTVICRDLLECDISDPEGLRRAMDEKLFSTVCPKFVQDAVEILEEMMEETSR